MYPSERRQDPRPRLRRRVHQPRRRDRCGASTSPTSRPTTPSSAPTAVRNRIFNLGYFTWVEQQGTPIELFEARRSQSFWTGLRRYLGVWDEMIADFNARARRDGHDLNRRAMSQRASGSAGAARCAARRRRRRHAARRSPVRRSIAEPTAATCSHPLVAVHVTGPLEPDRSLDDPNPFVAYGPRMAWWAFGAAHGMTEAALIALARRGRPTASPSPRSPPTISTCAGRADDGVGQGRDRQRRWQPQGPSSRRHPPPPARRRGARPGAGRPRRRWRSRRAATPRSPRRRSPQRAEWPLRVFVPEWAPPDVLSLIESLGADVVVCDRRDDDPPGDPALLRFREAVAAGALPFTVQGPENALCLDGGRTLGWELADAIGATRRPGRARPRRRPGRRGSVRRLRRVGPRAAAFASTPSRRRVARRSPAPGGGRRTPGTPTPSCPAAGRS